MIFIKGQRSQKGFAPILMVIIIVVVTLVSGTIYFLGTNKNTADNRTGDQSQEPVEQSPTDAQELKSGVLIFGKYSIRLPNGYGWDKIVESRIIPAGAAFDTHCAVELENYTGEGILCKYVEIKNVNKPDMKIVIRDTNKWPLGGGGYVPTVDEDITMGPKGYETAFKVVWSGLPQANGEFTKILSEKGNPELSFITGCMKQDLCIHVIGSDKLGAVADNYWQYEEFKNFVNSLVISRKI